MKKILLGLAIFLSPLLCNSACACVCIDLELTPEQEKAARLKDFKSAAAIFTGEVIELETNKVKFKVEKIWKGKSVDEITMVILLKQDNGRFVPTSCDYYYELGKKYLVYAYDTKGELTTYSCTRTISFKHAEIVEQEIKGLDEIKLPEIRKKKSEQSLLPKGKI
jgi:hypothetical protein